MVGGLFVGRFQPFHKGHKKAIEHSLKHCDKLTIVIGSPKKYGEENNPFKLEERKKMLKLGLTKKTLEKTKIKIIPDYHKDKQWTREIEKIKFDVAFTNNSNVEECLKKHEIKSIPVEIKCNATEVRRKMYLDQNWKECVPPKVVKYLERIKAPERIKKILK